ncbi:leucine-rich repeat protein [uncultured Porphyromonas sp.]|uniref:leucine-rich repeat protein n=1 Tax=uncultured Porphyromonas sp. TaxID=159274 RepID=UPI00261F5DF5|nr:leucine-rich repeat protein [uncultured Porphyromonas sp.]
MKRHPLTFALALLTFLHPLRAQNLPSIPPEDYSLSPDGRTLLHWKGQEAYLNMAIDPVLKWIDTIAPQATYYVDSLGQVAGQPFLQELILPFPLRHISSQAFYCPYLRHVLLNKGLRSMEQWAFLDGAFSEIRLPATLQHYEEGAIMGRYLETIEVEEGSPYLAVQQGCLVDLTSRTLLLYPTGSLYTCPLLPEEIVRIGRFAFAMSPYVRHLEIPEGVTSIGQEAFRRSTSLTTLDLPTTLSQMEGIPWIDSPLDTLIIRSAFPPEITGSTSSYHGAPLYLYVPEESIALYAQSPFWQKIVRQIESIDTLEEQAQVLENEERPYRLVGNTLMLALPQGVTTARLYDHEGNLVTQWTSSGSYMLSPGIYLLRIGRSSYKLSL